MTIEASVSEQSLLPGPDEETVRDTRTLRQSGTSDRPLFADTTMLYAPRSGGVKRYLTAKRAWLQQNRPGIRHALVVPGARQAVGGDGLVTVPSAKLPFGDGYRWPTSVKRWSACLASMRPDVIEAGDPYTPGQAAIEAGQRIGAPVVGFCHSDPAALAALHLGEWAKRPVEKRWARLFSQFDRVVSPSRFIARRLEEAGVANIMVRPLGVEIDTFHPDRRDRGALLKRLGLAPETRLLVFAGRPAREKNIDVLIDAVQSLGDPYRLLLVGAGTGMPAEDRVISLPYERDPRAVARIIASCDAFVHANHREPFGLIVLEAMACGVPVVGVNAGGVAETVDDTVGQLASAADPRNFAAAIEALFARDVEALGHAARARAVDQFAWGRVFEELCMLYGELSGQQAFVQPAEAYAVH